MSITARDLIETGQLNPGITLLEASAGTGKTHQITNLVVRLVAEHGIPMREILVVTFTKAATAELIDRIRLRLGQAAAVLRSDSSPQTNDGMLLSLFERGKASGKTADWLIAIGKAQESFDQALISTIDGFCQRMLQQNAFESGAEFGLELLTNDKELIAGLVDDYLSKHVNTAKLERYKFLVESCGFGREALNQTAREALRDPHMKVVPLAAALPVSADFKSRATDALTAWDTGWQALGTRWDQGKPTKTNLKKFPGMALFASNREGTYIGNKLKAEDERVRAWLTTCAAQPTPDDAGKLLNYFDREKFESRLETGITFNDPLFDELCELITEGQEAHDADLSNRRTEPWHDFVTWIREAFEQRKADDRVMVFSDLMRKLADALDGPQLISAIRPRFRAALIDEFQDTDRVQWKIFEGLFGTPSHFLFLIGDPKQAIYGFRGANVHVYVDVKKEAQTRLTMDTNFRSDARYVEAMNKVMGRWPASLFGDKNIPYELVDEDKNRKPADRLIPPASLASDPWMSADAAPLQIKFSHLPGEDADEAVKKGPLGKLLPARVAADVVEFLEAGWTLKESEGKPARRVTPGDIAVLVRAAWQAKAVMQNLIEAGVPAVMPGADSVFNSDEARDLQRWLEAVARPKDSSAARSAATTHFFGWNAAQLRSLDDPKAENADWDQWLDRLNAWHHNAGKNGVLPTFRAAMQHHGVTERLLKWPDGERRLTNLLHLLELTHGAELEQRLHLEGLIRWLADERQSASSDDQSSEMHLERDDAAVRILTIHKSKGLQFPIVWAPFLYNGLLVREGSKPRLIFPTEADPAIRQLDLQQRPYPAGKEAHIDLADTDAHTESVRLLYVAMTRARYRTVLYTGKFVDGMVKNGGLEQSPLGLLLHSLDLSASPAAAEARYDEVVARIAEMDAPMLFDEVSEWADEAKRPDGTPLVGVTRVALDGTLPEWKPLPPLAADGSDSSSTDTTPGARVFNRQYPDKKPKGLDHTWQRLSYTSLSKGRSKKADSQHTADAAGQQAEFGARDFDQNTDKTEDSSLTVQQSLSASLPAAVGIDADVLLASFPGGTDAGTFLHELFEVMDFQQFARDPDGDGEPGRIELEATLDTLGPKHGMNRPDWRKILMHGMPPVMQTPLGGDLGDLRLADIPRARRLDELSFDMPVAGGLAHRRQDSSGHVAWPDRMLGQELGEAFQLAKGTGPSDAYIDSLRNGWQNHKFAGYLTGSIDLVFATPLDTEQLANKFWVADYKSNKLDHLRQRKHPSRHFCQAWMQHEMEHHDYFVQATLYTLAVHRFLQQRLAEYDYDRNLGGALYVFFRGMIGEQTPQEGNLRRGVFHHRPKRELIERLDALLHGGAQ